MKVLHINSYYLLRPLHQTMMEHLDETGVNSEVMAHTTGVDAPVVVPRDNVHILKCFNKFDKPFFFLKQNKMLKAAKKEFNLNEFDFTHAYSLFSSGNCSYEIKKQFGIPYLVAIRDTDMNVFLKYKPYLKKRGWKILQEASKVFFLSPTYKKDVIQKLVPVDERDTFEKKCEIVPNGIDDFWLKNKFTERHKKEDDEIKVLYVGELTKRKNLPILISAIKYLRGCGKPVSLTVIGKQVDKEIFNSLKNFDFISYYEPMPKERLINYYRSNDIFVLPSVRETFGLVYAEALSQGMPVLYTRGQGFDGQFEDGTVGWSIDPKNPEDIAEKILRVYGEYQSISGRCLSCVEKFSWSQITKRYAQVYEELKQLSSDL